MTKKSITASLLWDKLGIGVSGICAIHCLLLPVVISVLPMWPLASHIHDWAHPVFILLIIPTVYFAARRSHNSSKIVYTLGVGLILVLSGWLVGHFWLGMVVETFLTVIGSVFLIIGHWFNYRHHRTCTNTRHDHHPVEESE